MKKLLLIISFFFAFQTLINAQASKLANSYFSNGEYEKAAALYKSIYKKDTRSTGFFNAYLRSLMYAENYEEATLALKGFLRKNPNSLELMVRLGVIYERTGNEEKAKKIFSDAIDKISNNKIQIIKLANAFKEYSYLDLALKTYEIGIRKVSDKKSLLLGIGDLYALKNDQNKMIFNYLEYLTTTVKKFQLNNVKNKLSRNISDNYLDTLRVQLVEKIQDNPDNINLIDLLSWVYLTQDNYEKARRQIIAIDRRFDENGMRVYSFAQDAYKAKKYKTSAKAYKYIIDNKVNNSPYLIPSIRKYLEISSEILVRDTSTTKEDFLYLENQYKEFIDKYGISNQTATLVIELAKLKAFNLNNIDKGISILKDLIKRKYIDRDYIAKAKLELGDFYLIKNEIWESTLLYSQVDKEFKEGALGELARYKNGKLSYYNGDFEWAQIIFDILKPATSRMISNDAIETSVFITETIGGEDTIVDPLKMFAKAELLLFQERLDDAISTLDSINFLFPKNNLEDDIWYLKANIFKRQKKYKLAIKMYNQVIEKYPEELKADNSIFELAELYEYTLNDLEKAASLYEKLFLEYDNSTLAIEARKKYRELTEQNVQ